MAVLPDLVRSSEADHLTHRLADLHLDVLALANHSNVRPAELTQKIQRSLRFLTERKT
jgi:hypothetical protein